MSILGNPGVMAPHAPPRRARPGRRLLAAGEATLLLAALLPTMLLIARMARHLPAEPLTTGDSAAYLELAAYRPPFYGWLVNAWQDLSGGLSGLPLLQLGLLGAAVGVLAIETGRLLRSPLAALLAVPLLLMHPGIHDAAGWLMTETVFVALVMLGLALMLRHARRADPAALALAAALFALATLTRSTGLAFLPLPLLAALFDRRWRPPVAAWRAGFAAAAAAAVVLAGMGWTQLRHGHFELGSWAGISLLGKALVLARPGELPLLPPAMAEEVAAAAATARRLIAEQPDLAATLRAQVQATSDVRFAVFWPAAETRWPAWMQADGRGKGALATALSVPLVRAHPGEFLRMWANDWLALVLHPNYWPASLTAVPTRPQDFAACAQTGTCWGIDRYDLPPHGLVTLFAVSVLGTLASLVLIPWLAWPVLRRRASPVAVLAWGMALVAQATLLVTAGAEAGHVRYTVALHVLDLLLLLGLAAQGLRAARARWGEAARQGVAA